MQTDSKVSKIMTNVPQNQNFQQEYTIPFIVLAKDREVKKL